MLKLLLSSIFAVAYVLSPSDVGANELAPTSVAKPAQKSIEEIKAMASGGNVAAQLHLAKVYAQGEGVKLDHRESTKWSSLAAEKGDPKAQTMLAAAYAKGLGVERNDTTAHSWYLLASLQDYPDANYMLGMRFIDGTESTPKNIEKGLNLLKRASEQKVSDALVNLGIFYFKGQHVQKNYTTAATFFKESALARNSAGSALLGVMYESGLGVEKSYKLSWVWTALSLELKDSTQEEKTLIELESKMTPAEIDEAVSVRDLCLESNYTNCP